MPDEAGDRIEALLRTTGRRPAAPVDVVDRVQAAARAHWKAEIARQTRRRRLWLAGVAAAVTLAVTLGASLARRSSSAPTVAAAASVDLVTNAAWARQAAANGAPLAIRAGDDVGAGSELATEERGRLALRLATGHSLRLDGATRVKLIADRVLVLERGAVYVDSRHPKGRAIGSLEIRTPAGTVRDIGTQFEVRRVAGSLRVRVREGTVLVERAGDRVEAGAGRELEVAENGRMEQRDWTAWGPGLEWVGDVTPMLDIEGRSLQEFLEWIARERALRLEFSTPDAARAAPRIVLNGSIDGMTLEQALESVLLTARMAHRIDGGVLVVRFSK